MRWWHRVDRDIEKLKERVKWLEQTITRIDMEMNIKEMEKKIKKIREQLAEIKTVDLLSKVNDELLIYRRLLTNRELILDEARNLLEWGSNELYDMFPVTLELENNKTYRLKSDYEGMLRIYGIETNRQITLHIWEKNYWVEKTIKLTKGKHLLLTPILIVTGDLYEKSFVDRNVILKNNGIKAESEKPGKTYLKGMFISTAVCYPTVEEI